MQARAGFDDRLGSSGGYGFTATPRIGGLPTVCGVWYEVDGKSQFRAGAPVSDDIQTFLVYNLGNLAAGDSVEVRLLRPVSPPGH